MDSLVTRDRVKLPVEEVLLRFDVAQVLVDPNETDGQRDVEKDNDARDDNVDHVISLPTYDARVCRQDGRDSVVVVHAFFANEGLEKIAEDRNRHFVGRREGENTGGS